MSIPKPPDQNLILGLTTPWNTAPLIGNYPEVLYGDYNPAEVERWPWFKTAHMHGFEYVDYPAFG